MKKINSHLNFITSEGKEATNKTTKRAFTLVELIVVITILAILGMIAFISLQGYSADARDSARVSDISKIKTSLELFQLDAGKYPETTDSFTVTYSGATAWTQGYFGDSTFKNVEKLDKIPTDPMTDRQYIYSVTNTKQEYEIAGVMEGELTQIFPLPMGEGLGVRAGLGEGIAQAVQKTANLKISGNYNGKLLKVNTGSITYVLAVPSIITSSGITLEEIINNNYLAYNGYKNLPSQYQGNQYEVLGEDNLKLVNSTDLVVYTGDLKTLSDTTLTGITARKELIENLQKAYTGTQITHIGEIGTILSTNTSDTNATELLSTTIVNNNLGGSLTVTPTTEEGATGTFNLSQTTVTQGTNVTITNNCSTPPTGYTSSNEEVATISGNTITTLLAGTTQITPVGGVCGDNTGKTLTVTTQTFTITTCPTVNSAQNGTSPTKTTILANINNYIGCNTTGGQIAGYTYSGSISLENKMVLVVELSDTAGANTTEWGLFDNDISTLANITAATNSIDMTNNIAAWDGLANTQKIVTALGLTSETDRAAQKCNAKGTGRYLPATEELNELYCYNSNDATDDGWYGAGVNHADCVNKGYIANNKMTLLNFPAIAYRSSTEYSKYYSRYQFFANGTRFTNQFKTNVFAVRCVSRF